MIWMTWRQHRREALIFAIAVVAMAIYLLVMGRAMYNDYYQMSHGWSVALCEQGLQQQGPNCDSLVNAFFDSYGYSFKTQPVLIGFFVLPPLLGMFVGAPLVAREMESGTFRLIWTQSVTRLRWLLTKTGALVGVLILVFAAFIPLIFWWKGPFAIGGDGIGGQDYAIEGTLPLAYATFAVALGLAAGALLRRIVPAMFVTLAGYVGVALALGNWGRPNWLPPVSTTWDPYLSQGPTDPGRNAWLLYIGYVDKAGERISLGEGFQTCASGGSADMRVGSTFNACIHNHGWLFTYVWQPADRFWAFQGIESGVLIALAVALLALTIWLVRRRIA
jgi:hypothetical protein